MHLLRVVAISVAPTDGTYTDFGRGQGEFVRVRLEAVLFSPERIGKTRTFTIHPYPGDSTFPPEMLKPGYSYLVVYPFSLGFARHEPIDTIGLTRCGVLEDTLANERRVLALLRSTHPTR
ncbi:hypothetical protein SAMN05421819_3795 [Bryocella elongata]|uniref:Uncharacterized protein n=1 Tax=Bryocella elongata TaxID=863522 RepID=A0A1H6BLN8_9BACT|nr:hypothetical protein SAMN05421819_3795 [Bryocella elongata]